MTDKERYQRIAMDAKGNLRDAWNRFANKWQDIEAYKRLLDPAVFLPANDNNGSGVSLMSGLHSLELMKNSLLTFESSMLSSLVSNN